MSDRRIHDAHGFSQTDRRKVLRAALHSLQQVVAAQGRRFTWTEEGDGVTVRVEGEASFRITYAELAQQESAPVVPWRGNALD
jgi:hypothetical protein